MFDAGESFLGDGSHNFAAFAHYRSSRIMPHMDA
jgi:hypothetical protein